MSTDSAFSVSRLPVISDDRARANRESGRVAGYAAGWAQGSRAAAEATAEACARREQRAEEALVALRNQFAAAVDALTAAADAAAVRVDPVLAEANATLLAQSMELARAIIGVELSDDARSAQAALTRALAVPADVELVRIRLSERDMAALDDGLALSDGQIKLPDGVQLQVDLALTPGDAISEYDGGFLDSRIGTAVARAHGALQDALTQVQA